MKLIDADELMEKIYSVKYLRKIKSKQLIDECKRIDAIPIKWIEGQLENEKDFFERVNSPKHKWECEQRIYCLRDLLIKWRKENESNSNS